MVEHVRVPHLNKLNSRVHDPGRFIVRVPHHIVVRVCRFECQASRSYNCEGPPVGRFNVSVQRHTVVKVRQGGFVCNVNVRHHIV
jgi:hypothetical protein